MYHAARSRRSKLPLTALENLNELLLLTVQSVCNTQSVKIPWAEVAKTMGNNVTEGAIVQHLAKLRSRRAAIGKDVPPPLRRGGIGAATKPSKTSTGSKRKATRSPWAGSDGESSVPFECDDDSDEDYSEKRRTKPKPKKAKKPVSSSIKQESDSENDNEKETWASSDELLVPGADFLDFPNDMSEDSSIEYSPGPTRVSKVVVLRFTYLKGYYRDLVSRFEESLAPVLTEAGGVDYGYHANMSPANLGPDFHDLPDVLLYHDLETRPEVPYISPESVTYGNPLENHNELPIGMMDHSEFSLFQDLLGPEGNLDFS